MHKCAYKKCNEQIEDKYRFCFKHKNTRYIDTCAIHGKTHFINNQCLKCLQMKAPIYIITKKNNKYYYRNNRPISKNSILYPLLDRLVHTTREYQEPFIKRVSEGPGIYGIFVRKDKELGDCLYIGQSVNVKNRVQQHKECFKTAQYHINGLKRHKKRIKLSSIDKKVEYKYYVMANNYNLKDLKFVKIISLNRPDKCSDKEFKEALTYCEQAMMIAFHPRYNTFAARPTK